MIVLHCVRAAHTLQFGNYYVSGQIHWHEIYLCASFFGSNGMWIAAQFLNISELVFGQNNFEMNVWLVFRSEQVSLGHQIINIFQRLPLTQTKTLTSKEKIIGRK